MAKDRVGRERSNDRILCLSKGRGRERAVGGGVRDGRSGLREIRESIVGAQMDDGDVVARVEDVRGLAEQRREPLRRHVGVGLGDGRVEVLQHLVGEHIVQTVRGQHDGPVVVRGQHVLADERL